MGSQNYGIAEKTSVEAQKEIGSLLSSFREQNERLIQMISTLEDAGDRLKNTEHPKESNVKELAKESGWMYDLYEQAERFRIYNNRLNEFIDKLNSII